MLGRHDALEHGGEMAVGGGREWRERQAQAVLDQLPGD